MPRKKIDWTYYHLPTPWGVFGIAVGDDGALLGLKFPAPRAALSDAAQLRDAAKDCYNQAAKQLIEYLNGKRCRFRLKMDIGIGTEFQQKVWREIEAIPPAQTITYGELARRIGKPLAVRAVGTACGANCIPVFIPCHRVVAANSLGGFGSGLEVKVRLLEHEKKYFSCEKS